MNIGFPFIVNILFFNLLSLKDNPYFSPALKLALIIFLFGSLAFYFIKRRIYRKGTPGRKLTFNERLLRGRIEITLSGNRSLNPSYILMTVRNTGKREVDLEAPVLIFKRWRSRRKFRVLSVEHAEIYPMFMDPGQESALNISLEQFYLNVPELRRACRLGVEMKDDTGRKFKSRTIRLKWI
jgi:hypothetical protein